MKIATEHAEGERSGTRSHMEERFLFDRIARHAGRVAEGDAQRAVGVDADFADAPAPRRKQAAMSAGDAAQATAFDAVQLAGNRVTVEQTGCRGGLRHGHAATITAPLAGGKQPTVAAGIRRGQSRRKANGRGQAKAPLKRGLQGNGMDAADYFLSSAFLSSFFSSGLSSAPAGALALRSARTSSVMSGVPEANSRK